QSLLRNGGATCWADGCGTRLLWRRGVSFWFLNIKMLDNCGTSERDTRAQSTPDLSRDSLWDLCESRRVSCGKRVGLYHTRHAIAAQAIPIQENRCSADDGSARCLSSFLRRRAPRRLKRRRHHRP